MKIKAKGNNQLQLLILSKDEIANLKLKYTHAHDALVDIMEKHKLEGCYPSIKYTSEGDSWREFRSCFSQEKTKHFKTLTNRVWAEGKDWLRVISFRDKD